MQMGLIDQLRMPRPQAGFCVKCAGNPLIANLGECNCLPPNANKAFRHGGVDMVVITGQRNFQDRDLIWAALDKLNPLVVVEGEAPGADKLSGQWGDARKRHVIRVPAPWNEYGNAAGPIRNRWMLNIGQREADSGMTVCLLAFLDEIKYGQSKGTRNCIQQAMQDFDLPIVDGVSLILDLPQYESWLRGVTIDDL